MKADQKNNHFRHIVFFKLHDGITKEKIDEAMNLLKELGKLDGILEWEVKLSTDTRKGIVIVENGLFTNQEAYLTFKTSENHKKVGVYMSQIADWLIGDYIQ